MAKVIAIAKDNPTKAIILVGPQDIGKSTIANLAAKELYYDWVDTDDIICNKTKSTDIKSLFKSIGMRKFRALEREVLESLKFKEKTIISFGGGAHLYHDKRIYKKQETVIICLFSWVSLFSYHSLLRVLAAIPVSRYFLFL